MHALGVQLLIDLHDCDGALLDDVAHVKASMLDAARAAGATVIDAHFHRFAPQGVSGVVVIAESHLAIHTWPEHGYAAADVFTCSERLDPRRCVEVLAARLSCGRTETVEVPRGLHIHERRDGTAGL